MTCSYVTRRVETSVITILFRRNLSFLNGDIISMSDQLVRGPMNLVPWNDSIEETAKFQHSLKHSLAPWRRVRGRLLVFLRRFTYVPKHTAVHMEDSAPRMRGFAFPQHFLAVFHSSFFLLLPPTPAPAPASNPAAISAKISHYNTRQGISAICSVSCCCKAGGVGENGEKRHKIKSVLLPPLFQKIGMSPTYHISNEIGKVLKCGILILCFLEILKHIFHIHKFLHCCLEGS